MARTPVLAAGGIVMRRSEAPLIAVVRLRKRNDWVLPKGKLNDGETARAAAEREVLEETGHEVTIHEFVGTLVYETNGRSKIVHFWRMEAEAEATHELMDDVKAVAWLPLDEAIARLTRSYEQAFLAHVGPLVMETREARREAAVPATATGDAPLAPTDAATPAEPRVGAMLAAAPPWQGRPRTLLQRAWDRLRRSVDDPRGAGLD
jgi:8-oxo-dGTP diphosphatase